MKLSLAPRWLLVVLVAAACARTPLAPTPAAEPNPPLARKDPKSLVLHGQELIDDYHWLRRKDTPEVLAHLRAEAAYTDAVMRPTVPLQNRLYDEMLARIKQTDLSVPVREGRYFYYQRTVEGLQYPIHCRKRESLEAPEEVLLDLNEIAKREKFVSLGDFEVSDDGQRLAYSIDTSGFREYTLRIKDLGSGKTLAEAIPRVTSVAFARDGRTLLYAIEEEKTKRPYRVLRHVIGKAGADVLVYEEKDERFTVNVARSRSKDIIFLASHSHTTSEVRFVRAERPADAPTVIEPRVAEHEYDVDHRGDLFYIRSNSTGRNFRLVTAKVASPGRAQWTEIVPHRDDVMLEGVDVFKDFYVLFERKDALPRLRVTELSGGQSHDIPPAEPVYAVFPSSNPEFVTTSYRYNYQSPVTPASIFDWHVKERRAELKKRTEVLGGYDPNRYATAREHAVAPDGTRVPITLVFRKDTPRTGKNPLLLYGYGSYGVSMQATFSSSRFSLVDRGVVFAVAHIRGGGDLGKRWHDEGRMRTKMNTFTDFIASAEHLIKTGWTAPERLAIQGGSAGGLLMGAVTNLRPDLFRAVVAEVPFVDVINTMLDESLPLTVGEFEEWGNPQKSADDFAYMRRYSPYDNITPKAYPTMLVVTSYNDSQVMYWEPAKYVAKLRALKTDRNPLLLRINLDPAGHGGKSGRYERLREQAFSYAFVLQQLGVSYRPQ